MEAILSAIDTHLSSEESVSEVEMFDTMKEQDPDSLALVLAQLVAPSDSRDIDYRQVCTYLLGKLLTEDKCHMWNNNLSGLTQATLKSILLIHINYNRCSTYITEKLCYTISELCNNTSNSWPELFEFLQECITCDDIWLKVCFFHIFANLAPHICKRSFPDIVPLQSLFLRTMNDDTLHFYTRRAALAATINFIQFLSSLNELKRAESLYPAMMKTLDAALSQGDHNVLQGYIKLAKNEPRFFRIYIVDVVNTMFEIAENTNLEEVIRYSALDFLLTLVEAREKAAGMVKKVPRFIDTYFALLLNLLLDVKDEPSWHRADNCLDSAWRSLSCKIGLNYLKRFSNALRGKTVAYMAIEQLDAYLAAPEWEKRHAALIALPSVSKVMIKYLEQLVSMVLPSFKDPHPRVRWAAFYSIYSWSDDYSLALQEQYHIQVVPALVATMDDFEHPRVLATAVTALFYYFNKLRNAETLLPYFDEILNKLVVLLENDNQMVQQEALDALGVVANSFEGHFQKYYDFIMPHLNSIRVYANDKSNHMLHSKALACISRIGMVVGKEKSRDDIKQLIEVLISTQESPTKEFDSLLHILKAWVSITSCMGEDFSPYLSTVMPLVIKCAQLQPPDNIIYNDSIHKIKFGDEMVYAKTNHILRVKSLACGLLGVYPLLEEAFYPWISQATSILVTLVKFYMDSDTRKTSSTALCRILKYAKPAEVKGTAQVENGPCFKQLSCNIIHALEDGLNMERDSKVCAYVLHELHACIQICGPLLSEDMISSIIDVIKHVITESSCRREELAEIEKSEDFDAEEAELLREETETEENIIKYVGHILSSLVETFKAAFLPFFDELSPYIMPTKGKDKTSAESSASILIFIELVRQCNEEALRYYNIYIPFILEASNKEHPYLRQCALLGLVLCAEHGISIFKPFVEEALPRINEVIMHLHAREPENEHAFYNAVSVLVKICMFHQESIDPGQIIPVWLNCLPIKGDIAEAKDVHHQLFMMVERSDTELLGLNYEHFPKVLSVFAEVLCHGNNLATEETKKRMINVLKNLQKTIPPATWEYAWSLLLPQQDMELESVLSPRGRC